MNGERRNDIGNKVLIGVVAILVTTIMGFSIKVAGVADAKANTNTVNLRGMKVAQERTREDIKEMKGDIKSILRAVIK